MTENLLHEFSNTKIGDNQTGHLRLNLKKHLSRKRFILSSYQLKRFTGIEVISSEIANFSCCD